MTDLDQECKHGLTLGTCSICRHPANIRPEPLRVVARMQSAIYPGYCGSCDLPIYEGSPIAKVTDGTWERWVHSTCAP